MTTQDYLEQLAQDRDDLVDNLTTKGITGLTGDETFTELVPEVLNIPSGGGEDYFIDTATSTLSTVKSWIKKIEVVDTSALTNGESLFSGCRSLTELPLIDTSNMTTMFNMFSRCSNLTSIAQINTSNNTNMNTMFVECGSLTTVPLLNASKVTNISGVFSGCFLLTNFGGFENLGEAYSTTQSANYSFYMLALGLINSLTHDSLMNIINNLYDIATKGCNTQTLNIGSTNIAKLTSAEIQIATDKGWTVS